MRDPIWIKLGLILFFDTPVMTPLLTLKYDRCDQSGSTGRRADGPAPESKLSHGHVITPPADMSLTPVKVRHTPTHYDDSENLPVNRRAQTMH